MDVVVDGPRPDDGTVDQQMQIGVAADQAEALGSHQQRRPDRRKPRHAAFEQRLVLFPIGRLVVGVKRGKLGAVVELAAAAEIREGSAVAPSAKITSWLSSSM